MIQSFLKFSLCPLKKPQKCTFSYPVELHTKITNKIRVLDAFKNLQFISCFFDGFVIIRLKSYLQETFFIILPLFQITKEQKKKKAPENKQPTLNSNQENI